jgi:hypothetical protein
MQTESNYSQKLFHLLIFSIAMALLESAVVIYLRELYYPEGFTVALKLFDEGILFTEILREIATVVMLGGIAFVSGKRFIERFSYFLFCFAVWDIFYYIWLKILINWPESFFTWDILFLIPVTWLGPVLAPVICSMTMISLSLSILTILQKSPELKIKKSDWILFTLGSLIILFTFVYDYAKIIISNGWLLEVDKLMQNSAFIEITSTYIPISFNWSLFITGESILIGGIIILWAREFKPPFTFQKTL